MTPISGFVFPSVTHPRTSARRWFLIAATLGLVAGSSLPAGFVTRSAAQGGAGVPIVYSRCPRTRENVVITGPVQTGGSETTATKTLTHADVLDALPDVSHFFTGFVAPCDLVYRGVDGS